MGSGGRWSISRGAPDCSSRSGSSSSPLSMEYRRWMVEMQTLATGSNYYTAYPHATANDVKSAHIVQSSLDQLGLLAEQCNPQQFADAYLRFVLQVQSHIGETGEAPIAG